MTGVSTAVAPRAHARNVLVIEDEVLIAMLLEDMLGILGHAVVATPATFAEAEAAVAAGGFDLVIADVNLGPDPIYPLADRIRAAGIPLVFATGSHRASLPPRFADAAVLDKPYTISAIEAVLTNIS